MMDAAAQPRNKTGEPLLRVRGLRVAFTGEGGTRTEVVRGIDLDVARGERVALVPVVRHQGLLARKVLRGGGLFVHFGFLLS